MTARSDLQGLLALHSAPRTRRVARTAAVLAAHKDAIAAACEGFVFDAFDGDDAAAAWTWVKGLEVQAKAAAKAARRALPLAIRWVDGSWSVDVVDGRRALSLVDDAGAGPFFGRLLERPDVRRARALLAAPHDVTDAGATAFFAARPPRRAPLGRLVGWLHDERFGPFKVAARQALDDIGAAAVDAIAALDVNGATPLARWQRLSSSLKAANVSLWLDVKPRSIAMDAEVWLGAPARGWWGPAVASAVDRLLHRSGLSPAGVAALYEDVAGRARPTRSLWIETQLHLRRTMPWNFARPAATTTKAKNKATKKKKKKKKKTKTKTKTK